MNPNIQKHIGSILVALAGIGTELLGKTSPSWDEALKKETEAEPTNDKPKQGRPRKTAETAAPVEPTSSSAPPVAAATVAVPAVAGAKTWEELKEIARPMVMGQKDGETWVRQPAGEQLKKIVDKYLPDDRKGQGLKALSEFPQAHGDFARDVEAFLL